MDFLSGAMNLSPSKMQFDEMIKLVKETREDVKSIMNSNSQMHEDRTSQNMELRRALTMLQQESEKKDDEFERQMTARDLEYRDIIMERRSWQGDRSSFHVKLSNWVQKVHNNRNQLLEKLQRQKEEHERTEKKHQLLISNQQEAIADLIQKTDALKVQGTVLYDDKCTTEWRALHQRLENWVTKSFRNAATLNTMTSSSLRDKGLIGVLSKEILEQSSHTRRAYIASFIIRVIFDDLFGCFFVQTPTDDLAKLLESMAHTVHSQGDSNEWQHWRSSTSTGLECFSLADCLRNLCTALSQKIDYFFAEYYDGTFARELLHDKLSEFVMACASFKRKLERGEFDYKFQCSGQGQAYSAEHMRTVNAEDGKILIVQMCLWPGIFKVSADGDVLLIEQEAVWTSPLEDTDEFSDEFSVDFDMDIVSQGQTLKREMER